MKPQYLRRRSFAFAIDALIFTQLAFFAVLPFVDDDNIWVSGGMLTVQSCQDIDGTSAELREWFPIEDGETSEVSVCRYTENGFDAGRYTIIKHSSEVDGMRRTRIATLAMNDEGIIVDPSFPAEYLGPIFILVGLILVTWYRRGSSIGKSLMGIAVLKLSGERLSLKDSAKREILKFLPLLIPAYITTLIGLIYTGEPGVLSVLFSFILVFVPLLVFLVIPLLRWRGAMPYDRACKTEIGRIS